MKCQEERVGLFLLLKHWSQTLDGHNAFAAFLNNPLLSLLTRSRSSLERIFILIRQVFLNKCVMHR